MLPPHPTDNEKGRCLRYAISAKLLGSQEVHVEDNTATATRTDVIVERSQSNTERPFRERKFGPAVKCRTATSTEILVHLTAHG